MSDLGKWEDYSELHNLESDKDFIDSIIPGNSLVASVDNFGEPEHVENCRKLAIQGGSEYSDDQTALVYNLEAENPLVQQALGIEHTLGDEGYEKAVRAGVNIGLGFQEAVEKIGDQANATCRTEYETPNVPHLEDPNEPARSLAYFIEESSEIQNQGVSAGILASAYLEED